MLHGIFGGFRSMGHSSEFEAYQMSLHESGLAGVPSVDQARSDYKARKQSVASHEAELQVA